MIRAPFIRVTRPVFGAALLLMLLGASTLAAAHWHPLGDVAEQHCSQCVLQDAPGFGSATALPLVAPFSAEILPVLRPEPVADPAFHPAQARAPPVIPTKRYE